MRRIIRFVVITAVVLVVVVAAGLFALRPPTLVVPSQGFVLTDMTIVNPGRYRRSRQTLVVRGAQIERIAATDSTSSLQADTRRFSGGYVLPGLIDMHVHFASSPDRDLFALLFLAYGVTTVRDTGNFDGSIWQTRQLMLDGQIPGPRIFACGPILDGDPPVWPNSRVVRTADEAQAAVDEVVEQGANCVKVYSLLIPPALTAIQEAAAQYGLPVIGHIPLAVPFAEAQLADVQHLTGVPPPLAQPPSSIIGWLAASWHELDSTRMDDIVRASIEHHTAHTPTLVVTERLSRLLDLQQAPDATAHLLPRYYRDLLWSRQEGFPYMRNVAPEDVQLLKQEMQKLKEVVRRLHAAGVRVHAGSDTPNPFVVPGVSLHEELRLLVDSGFTPEEAWVAATSAAGESLRVPKLGTVQEGALADLLIFREDPTHDLAALSTLEAVVTAGRLYPKDMLDQALARWRAHFEGAFYDSVSMTIARSIMRRTFSEGH